MRTDRAGRAARGGRARSEVSSRAIEWSFSMRRPVRASTRSLRFSMSSSSRACGTGHLREFPAMSIPATELPSGVNATLLTGCSMNRGGPIGCDAVGSQSRTDPSWQPTATSRPSPRNAAQMAGEEAAISRDRTAPVVASRSLTIPSLPSVRKRAAVGTKTAGRLVEHWPADHPAGDRVPEPGVVVVNGEQGPPVRPEFDPLDRFRAGQQPPDSLAACRIPKRDAGLARVVIRQTHRQYLAVRAVGQAEHDLALRQRPADLLAGGCVPEPHQAVEVARGEDLAVGLKGQCDHVIGVQERGQSHAARARVPEPNLARGPAIGIAAGREGLAVRAEGETADDPPRLMQRRSSERTTGLEVRDPDSLSPECASGAGDRDAPVREEAIRQMTRLGREPVRRACAVVG